ncbi:MAG: TIGR00268 family protein [Candidatus Fraserbacteria bacterium RBG_16_55_9]|uniref:TIGR00268 family protein n=1 Tax=Fraserbacteria sp. (strain RBG_16_55_9) TaxID=1817864 RepID=A0A1F5UQ66_FRAXR|nr:MAG: TIGR00268 family protein [Candidatus Fraserbacteria bacterium RBG_16_55_9]
MTTANSRVQTLITEILEDMRERRSILVAFSGGVDSSVVAALAHRALGERALAVTAASETLPARELDEVRQVAREIAIAHRVITFSELASESFASNPENRCYFCQRMRMSNLKTLAQQLGFSTVASGTNLSDTRGHRPGLHAMAEHDVYQPLLEHRVEKPEVRAIAQELGLSVWDKPSMACLASRIPHGLRVTQGKLTMIEQAEDFLHQKGFRQVRVRYHDRLARIEVAPEEMVKIFDGHLWKEIASYLKLLGFESVTLDLEGYRTGSNS